MPDLMDPGARVSDRLSPLRSAKVELQGFTRATEDPMTEDRMGAQPLEPCRDGEAAVGVYCSIAPDIGRTAAGEGCF